jgi:hypothetical protein
MGILVALISIAAFMFSLAYFRHSRQKQRSSKLDPAKAYSISSSNGYSTSSRTVLGSHARLSNWTRSLRKCIFSAMTVASASLCAYALSESQPFGPIEWAQLATLLLQLAGLLPQIGISMLAYECLHMGIAAGLNGEGLALGLLDSAANGLEVTSLLLRPSALRHKGSVVRIIAIIIGIIAGLLRFTLAVYPLLPGGIDGSQANATFDLIGEQVAACPSCADFTSYLRIANSITAVGSATFRTNFTQPGDALIIPPFVYSIDSAGGPSVETEQDTLKLSLCQHTNLTKPIARVGDMEFTTETYGRTVFGLADGVFKFSMAFGENSSSPFYETMECQAQLTRYKYIQDVDNGGPIQIIHELNSSTLPVYNLSWPGFTSYVYAEDLQLEWINNKVVGTRDFIGIMVSMLGGTRLLDYNIMLTAGRQVGPFRLNALAVILLTATSIAVWTVAAGLLLWYTYRADCIATAADSGLLTAACHGPELDQLLQGGCNGEIPLESALTVVRARRVGSHVEITSTRGQKVTEEQWLG